MLRSVTVLALASTAIAFQPTAFGRPGPALRVTSLSEAPYFVDTEPTKVDTVDDAVKQEAPVTPPAAEEAPVQKKKPAPKKAKKAPAHKEGVFSPLVLFMKQVLGDEKLNKVRAKGISLHSDVIANFVATSESAFGDVVLRALFKLADKDNSGTICKDELRTAMESLGFAWMKEKQINGIFDRADVDGNGSIDMDEWLASAPKTLRTNLIKLAKKNGGELGFLS